MLPVDGSPTRWPGVFFWALQQLLHYRRLREPRATVRRRLFLCFAAGAAFISNQSEVDMFFQMGDPAPGPNLRMQCIDKTLALYAVGHKCERSTIMGEDEPPPSMQLMLDDAERLFQWCTKDPKPEPVPPPQRVMDLQTTPLDQATSFVQSLSDESFERFVETEQMRRQRLREEQFDDILRKANEPVSDPAAKE